MKKLLVIICILICTGCINPVVKKEDRIGKSNSSNNEFQIKVIIDQINIREESTTKSEIIGKVKKDSIFTVLDYKVTDYYIWFEIKTSNGISGFIASDIKEPYVEYINGYIDIEKPSITVNEKDIKVSTREEINQEFINKYITVSDNHEVSEVTYNIDYENLKGRDLPVIITAKDNSNNSTSITIDVELTKEKRLSNGNWITYAEFDNVKNSFIESCRKYGEYYSVSCNSNDGVWDYYYNSANLEVRLDPYRNRFCEYNVNKDFEPFHCYDNGIIPYETMEDTIKQKEQKAIRQVKEIIQAFKKSGYDLSDLEW